MYIIDNNSIQITKTMSLLLSNTDIKNKLESKPYYDLKYNNDKLGIIRINNNNNDYEQLIKIFNKLITNKEININYYYFSRLFKSAKLISPTAIIDLVLKTVQNKINTIKDSIYEENGNVKRINLGIYNQILKSYNKFFLKMYDIIKNHQDILVEKNIKTGNVTHNILSIIQRCSFYNNIIKTPNGDNLLSMIHINTNEINNTNIEQLIEYIDSLRSFMTMQNFANIDRDTIYKYVKLLVNQISTINALCLYVHNILLRISNIHGTNNNNNTQYETYVVNKVEKINMLNIYKICAVLLSYGDSKNVYICWSKYMQIRIIDLKYDNINIEIELVKRISGLIGKENSQKLIDTISDIINTKNSNKIIHNAKIKHITGKYINLSDTLIDILNPIIISKSWKIYNIVDMNIIYPPELDYYFNIMTKSYQTILENKYNIEWQPCLGCAQFIAKLNSKKIKITCNILQSILLMHLNDNPISNPNKFSSDTSINYALSKKIFQSLFDSTIISSCSEKIKNINEKNYKINHRNYTGDDNVDLVSYFVNAFCKNEMIYD